MHEEVTHEDAMATRRIAAPATVQSPTESGPPQHRADIGSAPEPVPTTRRQRIGADGAATDAQRQQFLDAAHRLRPVAHRETPPGPTALQRWAWLPLALAMLAGVVVLAPALLYRWSLEHPPLRTGWGDEVLTATGIGQWPTLLVALFSVGLGLLLVLLVVTARALTRPRAWARVVLGVVTVAALALFALGPWFAAVPLLLIGASTLACFDVVRSRLRRGRAG